MIVPEYEERQAAAATGRTWEEWRALDRDERIASVAYYRAGRLIELHIGDASTREMERKSRMKPPPGRRR